MTTAEKITTKTFDLSTFHDFLTETEWVRSIDVQAHTDTEIDDDGNEFSLYRAKVYITSEKHGIKVEALRVLDWNADDDEISDITDELPADWWGSTYPVMITGATVLSADKPLSDSDIWDHFEDDRYLLDIFTSYTSAEVEEAASGVFPPTI